MHFIGNKHGPYKLEMHIREGAAGQFTEEDVKKALPDIEIYDIEIAGKVGEDFSIFMFASTNKDIQKIGELPVWKIT